MADLRLTPEPAEQGRYAVYAEADGTLVICRAAPLCETCAACGCGTQSENIRVPGMIVKMAMRAAETGKVPGFMRGFSRG